MRCPKCGSEETKVIDSRRRGGGIHRVRECRICHYRFETDEIFSLIKPKVIKRNGRREPYDRKKLVESIKKTIKYRPLLEDDVEDIASRVEARLFQEPREEIVSVKIGRTVLDVLGEVDMVAYTRYRLVFESPRDNVRLREIIEEILEKLRQKGIK